AFCLLPCLNDKYLCPPTYPIFSQLFAYSAKSNFTRLMASGAITTSASTKKDIDIPFPLKPHLSPFYAFDEVNLFLDRASVERLARMIKQQTQQTQFIVVSLRRPMIKSVELTIGVTQARGAYTQVLGMKLQQSSS
ncbi:hypothetical protein VB713_24250, partial [Anabaena cylindrica UHCC 0172]|uniref:hypothetical protein n=1 Tax=Anabaena cylindrica TaxID=1165 RepID=UPI002B206083